jgi:ribosomal protein S3
MDFYSEVLLEIVTALGAALFAANLYALVRRRADRQQAAKEAVARARPGSPVRGQVRTATTGKLAQAPIARTITFMILGLVVAIWGVASLTS